MKPSSEYERSCAHTALRKRCIGNEYCKCAPTGGAAHSRSHCIDHPPHYGVCCVTARWPVHTHSAVNGIRMESS